ncbi:MAG TPA: hypothetical protein VF406_21650 [Thermodesulfobacteriota bacterium]
MPDVRLRYRRGDEPDELSCKTVDDAIDVATAQLASGEAWPVEIVVDGRVAVREPELVEEARRRLGEDDEEDLR